MPSALKLPRIILPVLVGVTVAQRLGINVSSYPADFGLLIVYTAIPVLLWRGEIVLDPLRVALFVAVAVAAASSYLINPGSSLNSALLLLANYAPFALIATAPVRERFRWQSVGQVLSGLLAFLAAAGIVQFLAQFIYNPDWLFDFTPYLPDFIQNNLGYNTVISTGHFNKSNGFFLREPSTFSQLMALGLILEYTMFHRGARLAMFAFALVFSYSGTGLLVLLAGLLPSFRRSSLVPILIVAVVFGAIFLVFGDTLGLSVTLGRMDEFGQDNSSAYYRFIAPIRLLTDFFAFEPWSPLIGHGPGWVFHFNTGNYEFFDPTWLRLILEYGLAGTVAIVALFLHAVWGSHAPLGFRIGIVVLWLVTGEHLLETQTNLMIFVVLTLWPALPFQAIATAAEASP